MQEDHKSQQVSWPFVGELNNNIVRKIGRKVTQNLVNLQTVVSETQKIKRMQSPEGQKSHVGPQLRKKVCGGTTETETNMETQGVGFGTNNNTGKSGRNLASLQNLKQGE